MTNSAPEAAGREIDAATLAPGTRAASKNPWDRYGWMMALIWMVFLFYPVMALLHSTAPVAVVAAGWVTLVLFAVVYVVGFIVGLRYGGGLGKPPSRLQWVAFIALIVCAVASVPAIGLSALSFLPFVMSFASYGLTRLWHWIATVGGVLVTLAAVLFAPGGGDFASLLIIVGLLGVVNTASTWLIIRSSEAEQVALQLATSEGREAVARDVHDLVGHSLTVVRLKAQLALRLIDSDPERAKAEIADIETLSAEAIAGVRATVTGVRTEGLDEQLRASTRALEAAGIGLTVEGGAASLSPAQSLTGGWILREATTNILRHAKAQQVTVRIAPGVLLVEDDGVGLAAHSDNDDQECNGVRGMRERAAAAGARFEIGAGVASGTRVEVTW